MGKKIDAEELYHRMYEAAFEKDSDLQRWDSGCWIRFKLFENVLKDMPEIEVEEKTGHWIVDGSVDCYLDKVRCHCSECGKKKEFSADYDHIKHKLSISYQYSEFIENYCSNCGAKMEKESNKIEKICCNCIHDKESEPTIDCATCCEQNNFTPKMKGE